MSKKKLFTMEDLDMAIDKSLKYSQGALDGLYGRKKALENMRKYIDDQLTDINIKIDSIELERINGIIY